MAAEGAGIDYAVGAAWVAVFDQSHRKLFSTHLKILQAQWLDA